MNIFIAVFSNGFSKLQMLYLFDLKVEDISFARVLIGHVTRANQKLRVVIFFSRVYESDLVAWHAFDIILLLLTIQFQIDFDLHCTRSDKELYFPIMNTL